MTFKQWGITTILAGYMNTPLSVGEFGMDLAVTVTVGLALVLLFVALCDRRGR